MSIAKNAAAAAILLGMIAAAPVRAVAAGPKMGAAPAQNYPYGCVFGACVTGTCTAIFVANSYAVTAYPHGSHGDVAPLLVPAGMAAPAGIARDASGRLYVTNSATNTISVYAANANGNVAPIAVIGGPNTKLSGPAGIALDSSGTIYVLNGAPSPKGNVTVYPPLGSGAGILDPAPIATIAGSKTRLDNPTGIAVDSSGNIYVTNEFGGPAERGLPRGSGAVTVYRTGSNGNVAPIATISGPDAALAGPAGITLDTSGNIYVANGGLTICKHRVCQSVPPSIAIYSAGSNGDVPPLATIGGDSAGLDGAGSIAVDSSGNIYVVSSIYVTIGTSTYWLPSVNVYAAGSNGNVPPIAIISGDSAGDNTGLSSPTGIAVDPSGNIYAANRNSGPSNSGSVTIYPAGSNGDVTPSATITSDIAGLAFPAGIAMDSSGNLYVANSNGGSGGNGSVTVYPAGSYANVAPVATIAGDNTGLENPRAIALDSRGKIYVLNQAGGPDGNGSVTVYPAGSNGNAAPIATINLDTGGRNSPSAMAVDSKGNIYVANNGVVDCKAVGRYKVVCHQLGPDSIKVYPTGGNGSAAPIATISGPLTGLASPSGIAVDSSGEIYVTNSGPAVEPSGLFVDGETSDVPNGGTPAAGEYATRNSIFTTDGLSFPEIGAGAITGYSPVLRRPGVPKAGPVFFDQVSRGGPGAILVFSPGSNGDVAPVATISGPDTGLGNPFGIALDSGGKIYVLNDGILVGQIGFCVSVSTSGIADGNGISCSFSVVYYYGEPGILVYEAYSNGDAAPIAAIGGAFTGLYGPSGIAVGPAGP